MSQAMTKRSIVYVTFEEFVNDCLLEHDLAFLGHFPEVGRDMRLLFYDAQWQIEDSGQLRISFEDRMLSLIQDGVCESASVLGRIVPRIVGHGWSGIRVDTRILNIYLSQAYKAGAMMQ